MKAFKVFLIVLAITVSIGLIVGVAPICDFTDTGYEVAGIKIYGCKNIRLTPLQ